MGNESKLLDIHVEPPTYLVKKALTDYGNNPQSADYELFAMLISQGSTIKAAYQSVFPNANGETACKNGRVLCAHPVIRRRIVP